MEKKRNPALTWTVRALALLGALSLAQCSFDAFLAWGRHKADAEKFSEEAKRLLDK